MLTRAAGAVVVGAAPADRARATLAAAGAAEPLVLGAAALEEGLREVAARLEGGGRLVVVDAEAVLPVAAVARLVDDPSVGTGVLVARDLRDVLPLRTLHGFVASAGSEHHMVAEADTGSLGAVVVQPADAAAAAAAVREMADTARTHRWSGSVVDHLLVALVRREVAVRAVASPLPATRTGDPVARAAVEAALDGGEDARALRESGNRVDDGFYSTFVLRRLSKPVTELALRLGLSPNQVSLLSLAIGLGAAALFATGGTTATVVAALLLQLSLVVDCVDGEVARRTRRFSALGAWLDASTDRVKEYAVYGALAHAAGGRAWLLAGAVLVLQTVRHMGDYDFARVQRVRETWVVPRPLDDSSDGGVASHGAALDASRRASGVPGVRWVKKAVHMPIGERWLVISVVSVAVGPRAVLVALLVLGLVAAAYTTAGRLLRVRGWHHPPARSGAHLLAGQLDLAWLRAGALTGPLGWAVPAVLRLLELGLVLVLTRAVADDELPWAFALCFVLAFHHYDSLYRCLGGSAPPRWLVRGGLGVEGRLVVLVVAALLGASVLTGVLVAGTLALTAWFVVVASVQFVRGLLRGREVAA